jgi:ABC-2 type transport system ATP-binding protein
MMDDTAIKINNVSKSFKLPHEKQGSLKSAFVNIFRGRRTYEKQEVLKNISLEIKKGEFFGIVGRNGSGKSTLLKLLAGIYSPDSGAIQVNGKLTPFIELGVGFNPELTGRENVFLNGALLGFSREEMESMYEEIVAFAELERFMDQKLKNYSSGMQVRLAFSIAIRANTDILILDEVLAVGDENFQRKCFKYFATLKKEKKTVILVTHSMESVQQFCSRAMLLEEGKISNTGNPAIVAQKYSRLFLAKKSDQRAIAQNDSFNLEANLRKSNKKLYLSINLTPKENFKDPVLGVIIRHDNGEIIWRWASSDKTPVNEGMNILIKKNKTTKIEIELDNILPDAGFAVTVLVRNEDNSEEYARYPDVVKFDNYGNSVYEKFWKLNERIKVMYEKQPRSR